MPGDEQADICHSDDRVSLLTQFTGSSKHSTATTILFVAPPQLCRCGPLRYLRHLHSPQYGRLRAGTTPFVDVSVTFVLGISPFLGSRADAGASRSPEREYGDLMDRPELNSLFFLSDQSLLIVASYRLTRSRSGGSRKPPGGGPS